MLRILPALGQDDMNFAWVDKWTPIHFATGLVAPLIGVPFWPFLGVSAAYEVAEYWHEYPKGSKLFGSKRPESLANVATDLIAAVAGYWLVTTIRSSRS